MTEKLLDGEEMQRLAGRDALILSYPDLYKYNSIEDLFRNYNKIIILYLQTPNSGHWCCLSKYGKIVTFFDPYALMPDSEIKWNSKEKQQALNQEENYLTRLLYNFARKGGDVEYNEMRFQEKNPNINTCGRHAGIRAHFYQIPLEQYQQMFRELRNQGINLDQASVVISDMLLNQ